MPPSALEVLLVDHSPTDFEQALRGVRARDRAFRIAHVASVSHATARLTAHAYDVVVLDLALADSDGRSGFEALAEAAGEVPIVVLSGRADEHVAIDAVRRGAQDYLVKGQDDGPALAAALTGAIERKWAESGLAQLDSFHPLTGLPRRGLLERRIGSALERAERAGRSLPLLHLELGGLERIAATLGAAAADDVRRAAAERLAADLAEADTIGHPGEDGLALVAESLGAGAEAAGLACRLLDAIARPFDVADVPVVAEARVGIGLLPADGRAPAEALANARAAAQRTPAGSFAYCDAEMTQLLHRRRALLADLPHAAGTGQLALHFQPLVAPGTGEVRSVEALLRWHHPAFGLVSPGEFIPLAEESGAIVPLGEWALGAACSQLQSWDRAGLPPIGMAVNVSPRQFATPDLLPAVARAVTGSGVDPQRLELEVTESTLADPDTTARTLGSLRRLGVKVAIDDFGTGFSSLAYLRRLRADGANLISTIKIDRSFVSELGEDAHAGGVVTAILSHARELELATVAEGVETETQAGFLREQGCDTLQGYRICRPLPADEASAWLGEHAAATA